MRIVLAGTVSSSIFGFRRQLLEVLVGMGCEVYILATDVTPEIQQRAYSELGVFAEKYTLSRSGFNPFVDIKNAFFLYKRILSLRPDYALFYFAKPVIWGAIASYFGGVKNRYGMLEGLGFYFTESPGSGGWLKSFIRLVQVALFYCSLPLLSGVVLLNDDDREDLVARYGIPLRKLMVLGGIGVDLDEFYFSRPSDDSIRFIFVGRLLREKGIREFLSAAEIVKKERPDVEFVVLGDIDPENPGTVDVNYLNRLVKGGVIIYPGVVDDVADWLRNSSVFVLPSYREGVPRSTQEAMSIGRAVITTDVPGCRETIEDGVNGFKVPPFEVAPIVNSMFKFIFDPRLVSAMGEQSRILAERRFDSRVINMRMLGFLLES